MFEYQWGEPSRTPHKYIVTARQYVYMLACIDFGNHKQFSISQFRRLEINNQAPMLICCDISSSKAQFSNVIELWSYLFESDIIIFGSYVML